MNLVEALYRINPKWMVEISPDPLEAAIELGMIEDNTGNPPEVDFDDPEVLAAAKDFYRETVRAYEDYEE
jgi:hypothetical protein